MRLRPSFTIFVGILMGLMATPLMAEPDLLWLGTSGYAPSDAFQYHDPIVTLSADQIRDMAGEVKGLVELAKTPYVYSDWPGRSMSDCARIPWGYRCEIITGNAKAFYEFHTPDFGELYTLSSVDIHVQSTDAALFARLQHLLESIVGSSSVDDEQRHHWSSTHGVADLTASETDVLTRVYWRPAQSLDLQTETAVQPLQG